MAPTALTPVSLSNHKTSVVVDPATWSAGNATDGNTIPNGGATILGMNNSGASSRTVAVTVASTVDGQAVTAVSHTIAAGVVRYVKLGPPGIYGSTTLVTPSHIEMKLAAFTI